ncbi:MAG: energy-coupling factor transporter transmembrane component T, partial [Spirochaetales bacterium]
EKLHVPYVVVIPFTVMFRFFPTVQEEWNGIRRAMAFRGIGMGAKGLVLHPVRSAEHILVPLLFSCVAIMDELVAASLARGLDSDKKRTCYFTLKMKFYDYAIILITLGFFSMIFFMK